MSGLSEHISLFHQYYPLFSNLAEKQKRCLLKEYSYLERHARIEIDSEFTAHSEMRLFVCIVLSVMSLSPLIRASLKKIKTIRILNGKKTEFIWNDFEIQCIFADNTDVHQICFFLSYAFYKKYLISSYLQKNFVRAGISQLETALFYCSEKTNNSFWSNLCCGIRETDPLKWFACASEMYFFHYHELDRIDKELYESLEVFWRAKLLRKVFLKKEKKSHTPLHPVYSVYTIISFFVGSFVLLYLVQFVFLQVWIIIGSVLFLSTTGFIVRHWFKRYGIPILVIPYLFFAIFGLGVMAYDLMLITNMSFAKPKPDKVVFIPYSYLKQQTRKEISMEQIDHIYVYEYSQGITRQVVFEAQHFRKPEYFVIIMKNGLWNIRFISKTYVTYARE